MKRARARGSRNAERIEFAFKNEERKRSRVIFVMPGRSSHEPCFVPVELLSVRTDVFTLANVEDKIAERISRNFHCESPCNFRNFQHTHTSYFGLPIISSSVSSKFCRYDLERSTYHRAWKSLRRETRVSREFEDPSSLGRDVTKIPEHVTPDSSTNSDRTRIRLRSVRKKQSSVKRVSWTMISKSSSI